MPAAHAPRRVASTLIPACAAGPRGVSAGSAGHAAAVAATTAAAVAAAAAAAAVGGAERAHADAAAPAVEMAAVGGGRFVAGNEWEGLVAEVKGGSAFEQLRAVEALLVAANDVDNHEALVRAGAVGALVQAYRSGGEGVGETGDGARNVNVLRALADLSRTDGTHSAFQEASAHTLVVDVLKAAVGETGGVMAWLGWVASWVGLGGNVGEGLWDVKDEKGTGSSALAGSAAEGSAKLPGEVPSDMTTNAIPAGILGNEVYPTTLAAVANVDIQGGLVYHGTRCIANLARDTKTHEWLLQSDVLSTMVALLRGVPLRKLSGATSLADVVGDEQRADTVRFAALSVAAMAKSAPSALVEKGGHVPLIALLGQEVDSVAQTYAAGGIRNLARHGGEGEARGDMEIEGERQKRWLVHRQLVVDGLVPSLCVSLANASNPQTQVFSALAVGDILATGHAKAEIICKRMAPACEPFAQLLTSGNVGVARACHRALDHVLAGEADDRGMSLTEEGERKYRTLCEVTVEHVGPLVRGAAAKGDPVAMRAVSSLSLSEPVSDALVRKGIVSTLVNALAAKNDYGHQAMVALARLSGRSQHMTEIILRGGIKSTIQRSSEDGRWEAAALANMARAERNRPDIGHGGLETFLLAAQAKSDEARFEGARGLFNLTIGGVSRVLSAQGGALVPMTKIADSMEGLARRYAVGAIAAISELYGFGAKIVELDGIAILLRAVAADKTLARDVARVFAQLSNHVESHEALAKEGAAAWLVNAVTRGDAAADTLFHAAAALCNITYTSGAPHDALREAGAIAALTGLASGLYQPHVAQCARIALANIRGEADPVLQHADSHGQVDPV